MQQVVHTIPAAAGNYPANSFVSIVNSIATIHHENIISTDHDIHYDFAKKQICAAVKEIWGHSYPVLCAY